MKKKTLTLLEEASSWLVKNTSIESAVLFGSTARHLLKTQRLERWADIDLHIVAKDVASLTSVHWTSALPKQQFCMQVLRPATGGLNKATVVFKSGQLDLVLVPSRQMEGAADALRRNYHRRDRTLNTALNEMATCIHSGYWFIKGKDTWGSFYESVYNLPGIRIQENKLIDMGDSFLCDLLWVLQKIERGELVAAQHVLHNKLVDTILRLWRELRLRRRLPVVSFGLGRRLEELSSREEIKRLKINAKANRGELVSAANQTFVCLRYMMAEVAPSWSVSPPMQHVIRRLIKAASTKPTH